jgi:hypothetical protein
MTSSSASPDESVNRVVNVIGQVIAPVTLLTSLLYYFSWVRENAVFGYFGVDQSILKFSTTDYLLRSAGIAFRPLTMLVIVAGGLLGIHHALSAALRGAPRKVRLVAGGTLGGLGILMALFGLAVIFGVAPLPRSPVQAPISLGVGTALVYSSISLLAGGTSIDRVTSAARAVLSALLILIAIFWATAIYAQDSGVRVAQSIADNPTMRAEILLFSDRDLKIAGPGIGVSLSATAAGSSFRYCGLRLLIHASDRWLLLPEHYDHQAGDLVILVTDDQTTRVDFAPPGADPHRFPGGCPSTTSPG